MMFLPPARDCWRRAHSRSESQHRSSGAPCLVFATLAHRSLELTEDQQRALIFVRENRRITNSDYRNLNRVDTLTASQRLVRLRDLGLVDQVPMGPATYYVPGAQLGNAATETGQPSRDDLFSGLSGESSGLSGNSEGLSGESGGLSGESLIEALPNDLHRELEKLGKRSRDTERLKQVVLKLCRQRPYSARELAEITRRNSAYLQQVYLTPMVREGLLRLRYPDERNRPDQAYVATEEQE
nr:hypothetical protein [Algiphilus aromaticivorans]